MTQSVAIVTGTAAGIAARLLRDGYACPPSTAQPGRNISSPSPAATPISGPTSPTKQKLPDFGHDERSNDH